MTQDSTASRSTGNMKWLYAIRGAWSFNQSLLAVIGPLLLVQIGMSTTRVGILLSIISFGSAAMVLLVGLLADTIGRKPILIIIAILFTTGVLMYAFSTNFVILAVMGAVATIGRGGAGAGGNFGPFYPAEQAIIAASVRETKRTSAFAMISLVGLLVGALGALTAASDRFLKSGLHMDQLTALRALFVLAAALGIVILFLILHIKDTSRPQSKGKRVPIHKDTVKLLGKLWLTNSLNGFARGMLGPFLTYWFAVRFGVGSAQIGVLYTVISLLAALPYLGAARLVSIFGTVRTIVSVRFTAAALLTAMAFSPTFILAALSYVGFGIFNSLAIPIRQSLIMGVTTEVDRSKVAAMGNLPSQVAASVSPSIGARLLETAYESSPYWIASGVLFLNAIMFAIVFRNTKPPEEIKKQAHTSDNIAHRPAPDK